MYVTLSEGVGVGVGVVKLRNVSGGVAPVPTTVKLPVEPKPAVDATLIGTELVPCVVVNAVDRVVNGRVALKSSDDDFGPLLPVRSTQAFAGIWLPPEGV